MQIEKFRREFKQLNFDALDNNGNPAWKTDFEARYPEDNTDTAKLQAFIAWVASTDQSAATDDDLEEAVTYGGVTYTTDSAEYRLAKFKAEITNYVELDSAVFYYLFTELFLMVDSRAKNAFPSSVGGDKICFLPYDFDTAIGINNEGSLVFGYELEDTDQTSGGADIYNGQQSVLWINLRQAFPNEIASMYQDLRASGKLSYAIVENAYEVHQAKWCEAIWNEDAYYKYLQPLVENGKAEYLGMLQGSKSEQRKWWLYNRFRYIDSKYNAGDAKADFITLRCYAGAESGSASITIEPYADIYAAVKFGSVLVQARALRGSTHTLTGMLDNLNDTETYIYSASQIKSIGDLSVFKVGYADFSMATKLTSLKLGDSDSEYSNGNLEELHLGNNTLLQTLDVRNCTNLGNGAIQQSVDISGCTNIENVYFDGTAIKGLTLPSGGILKVLHLPASIKNLTLINQTALTDFTLAGYTNIDTLRVENSSALVDTKAIVNSLAANSRVRLIGFDWTFNSATDALAMYDKLDTFRGLDEHGNNTSTAQISGTIVVPSLTGAHLVSMQNRYPDITVEYESITSIIYFYNGSSLITSQTISNGGDATFNGTTPTKAQTAQYTYTFAGWSLTNGGSADANALKNVTADRRVYAAFTKTAQTYTVRFYNDNTLLETHSNVAYGESVVYTGSTPISVDDDTDDFVGWSPSPNNITGDTDCHATFQSNVALNNATWAEISAISNAGTGANYFAVGDCKQITLNGYVSTLNLNNYTTYVYIIGFDHNATKEGNGISFGTFKTALKNGTSIALCDSKYATSYNSPNFGSKYFNMRHSGTNNSGGWKDCDLRYDILGSVEAKAQQNATSVAINNPIAKTLMATLPADLRAVLKPITKYTDNQGASTSASAISTTVDYLPLLSEFEIFGAVSYSNNNERHDQIQYAYYSAGNSKQKFKHSDPTVSLAMYTRSPSKSSYTKFVYVRSDGTSYAYDSNYVLGIAPIFKV